MNIFRKTLASLAMAGLTLAASSAMAVDNSVAEKRAPTREELAKPNPDLKIETISEKFAEKYPKQYQGWADTAKSSEIVYADEVDPRLIVLWGGYAFSKEYNKPRGHFYTITDVRNILRTGAPFDANSGMTDGVLDL